MEEVHEERPRVSVLSQSVGQPGPSSVADVDVVVDTKVATSVKVLIGLLIAVFILGGIGAFFVFRTPSHIPADPQRLLFYAFQQIVAADDMRVVVRVPGATVEALGERGKLDVSGVSGVNLQDAHATLTYDILEEVDESTSMNVLFEIEDEAANMYAGVEVRSVMEDLYFRVVDLVFDGFPEEYDVYLDRWVYVDLLKVKHGVESFLGTSDEGELFDPTEYVKLDLRKDMSRMRDMYLAQPAFNLTLLEENVVAGTAKVRLQLSEYAEDFFVGWAVESYLMYLDEVDKVIVERDSIGDDEVIAGLQEHRDSLVEQFGEKGELLAERVHNSYSQDVLGDWGKMIDDVSAVIEVDTRTGRAMALRWEFVFSDGVVREPISVEFSGYNLGREIPAPSKYEEFMDVVNEILGGMIGASAIELGEVGDGYDEFEEGPDDDGDGLSNEEEKLFGTDPNVLDTDGDGLNDGDEVYLHYTSPVKVDTDGDGYDDKSEIDGGYDPLMPPQ